MISTQVKGRGACVGPSLLRSGGMSFELALADGERRCTLTASFAPESDKTLALRRCVQSRERSDAFPDDDAAFHSAVEAYDWSEDGLAVGDRITMGGAPGTVVALPERGWWKLRLDGEETVRSARRTKFAPAAAEEAEAPAPKKKRGRPPKAPAAAEEETCMAAAPDSVDSAEDPLRLARKAETVLRARTERVVLILENCSDDLNHVAVLRTVRRP